MVAAQKYPGDFDGILAGSPAIYWTEYVIAELWPQVVMKEAGYFPSTCEFAAVRADLVAACDELDGVKDGVVTDLARCKYDPSRLVGKTIPCGGEGVTFTATTASIVRKIWEGPKTPTGGFLWYGLPKDAPFDSLAATIPATNGTGTARVGSPFFVADTWTRYFVKADPAFDLSTLTTPMLQSLFAESVSKFSSIIDSSSPNLDTFRKSGGKLLAWHGTADPLIFPQDTVRYLRAVEEAAASPTAAHRGSVDDFFRVFLAPGTDHCGQGTIAGVAPPTDALGALVGWVERGRAPDALDAATLPGAAGEAFTRLLCRFPLVARYDGRGDPGVRGSYRCVEECG
jgi:hypothetical protein